MKSQPVSFIGLGDMGSALATALLGNGFAVTAWNRSPGKAEALAEKGAEVASSAADALAASPVTIVCLSDHGATMEVLARDGVEASAAGRTLIQLSTMTSAESHALAQWAAKAGADYLDGQILSYTDEVLEGRANIVCSGPRELFERQRELLVAAAGNVQHVGAAIGAAPTFDKAHLSFTLGSYLAFLQGAAMCADAGVDLRAWFDFNLRHLASGQVGDELAVLADQVCGRAYDAGLDVSVDVWRGAVAKTVEECEALGTERAHLASMTALIERVGRAGLDDQELGILFEQMTARKG